jgi:prepilin-type N-terminal cleavage/methylation domain-containing protein
MKVSGQWSVVSGHSMARSASAVLRVAARGRQTTDNEQRTVVAHDSRTTNRAFTLIELMVVVGIMALVMAIGIPFMANVVNGGKGISRAARDVQQVCSDTRALAILRQSPVELRIRPADGVFEPGASGSGDHSATGSSEGTASSVSLPEGVVIEALGVNGEDWTEDDEARVRFYPNGTSDEMRVILYRPSTGERRYLYLEVVTGLAVLAETEVSEFTKVR